MRLSILLLFGAMLWAAVPPSPKLEALRRSLRAQPDGAVEAFWAGVSRDGGTPLIECPAALKPDCLVTFLWRGDATTKNVVVLGEALPERAAENLFNRLPGTDVWYRTYRYRNDARFMYMLSINDPLTSWEVEGPERRKRYAGVRTDPLNKRTACYVSLPKAPSEQWSEERPAVARGVIRRQKLPGAPLPGEREIEVYTTPRFKPGRGVTPVLIMFDGFEARVQAKVPTILDNLFAEGRLQPMVAVLLPQPHERRETELGCNKATNAFLTGTVLPWVREAYQIRTAAGRTIAGGASLGGLAAAYAALEQPETFGRVLSQSGSFWWGNTDSEHEWLTAEFGSRARVNAKLYLDVGLMETKGGAISQLETNRHMRDVLRNKGYEVIYREFNGTHAFPCWRAGFADALLTLLSD